MSNRGKTRGRGQPQQQQQQQSNFPSLSQTTRPASRVETPIAPVTIVPPQTGQQRSVWGRPATAAPTQATAPLSQATATLAQAPAQTTAPIQVVTSIIRSAETVSVLPGGVQLITEQLAVATISTITAEQTASSLIQSVEGSPQTVEVSPPKSNTVRVLNGEFPRKRPRGDLGRLIKLRSNHYQMVLKKKFDLFQYDVEITRKSKPDQASAAKPDDKLIKNKRIMKEMFLKLSAKLGANYRNKIVYNFSKNLYSLMKLPFENSNTYEIDIDTSTFIVKLQTINIITIDPTKFDEPTTIQVLDLILTQNFNYSCVNLNRSFFGEQTNTLKLGFGLELWKGAYASVRPSEVGLTWNLDTANAAFQLSIDVIDLATYHYNCSLNDLKNAIQSDKDGKVIGVSFLDAFRGRDIKTATGGFRKKIQGFGPDSSHEFGWNRNNVTIQVTIREYLKQHYNIDLKYPLLPCVNLGRESYLPMELCKTELSQKKNLDERTTATIIKETAVRAPDRMDTINKWAKNSQIDKDPILEQYNISVNLKMVEMDGRVLDAPDIQYAPNNIIKSNNIGTKGSWDHRNYKFANSVKINNWIVLNFSRAREDAVKEFCQKFVSVGQVHGIPIKPCSAYRAKERPRDEEARRIFEEMYIKYHKPLEKNPLDLVLVVFGGTTTAYKVIKTAGDLTYGVPTQGVEDKNVNRISDQTISNILLKVNTKLGGRNFFLSSTGMLFSKHLQDLYKGPLMVFGADVTHPTPDNKITESIAAVVGSLDKECSFYAARLYAQRTPRGQAYEMIHDLHKMFFDLLHEFYNKNNGTFPKKIVFFRDGVSEGQFSLVLRHEINKIREACQKVSAGYKPAITFVIVQKRHHTRLFPVNQQDANGKAMNVPPGTVVDHTIVTQNMFDYFLCSHAGIQGTSRPCHYYVLHDDNGFTSNQMQLLSHYLCHVYARCPRSVSYPAPAYYSHLAAFRGRDYIRKTPPPSNNPVTSYEIEIHPSIKNKMFYC